MRVVGRLTELDSLPRRNFYNQFLPRCFQSHICECSNFNSYNFKVNINKNCEAFTRHKYFAVTLAEKTENKNLYHATPGPVMSQLSSSRKPVHVRKFNLSVYTKHTWLRSGRAERITLLSPSGQLYNPSRYPNIRTSHPPAGFTTGRCMHRDTFSDSSSPQKMGRNVVVSQHNILQKLKAAGCG
jgi:hypothetical protein